MADPNANFSNRRSDPAGVGPYQFSLPALGAGETYILDLREREKGKYVSLSPAGFDAVEVSNLDPSNSLRVLINEANVMTVPANSVQGLSQEGMYRFEVTNHGATEISADAVTIEIQKEPYGADAAARGDLTESPLRGVIRHFTGL